MEVCILISTEIEKAVAGGDVSSFRSMRDSVKWINSGTPAETLAGHCSHTDCPLGDSRLVILACKHSSIETLRYLFQNSDTIHQNIAPGKLDDEGHDAIYYSIRSGNVKLLEAVIKEWPVGYFTHHPEEMERVLSAAYDKLKLKNVLLSDEMELFVQNQLLNLRFFCKIEKANISPSNIVERIQLVVQKIRTLRAESSPAGVNEKFVYIATFVTQNLHILKQQLKSTYAVLPWEEMEFCLVCFISAHTKHQELNIFIRSVLSKGNILEYLDHFSNLLESLTEKIRSATVYTLGKPVHLNRDDVIADVLSQNLCFRGLYNSYKEIRDVYSLQIMKRYIDAALLAEGGTREGRLIIKRALQVMGEHLKNSLESPKLSEGVSELLLLSAPRETRKILTKLRNTLSKTHILQDEEGKDECKLFSNIQKDISKVGVVITDILYSKKIEKIKSFLTKVVEINSLDDMKEILEVFQDASLDVPKSYPGTQVLSQNQQIVELVNEINTNIVEKSKYEKDLIKQINEIIHKSDKDSVVSLENYIMGFVLLKSISCVSICNKSYSKLTENNILRGKKYSAKHMLLNFSSNANFLESKDKKQLATLLFHFQDSVVPRVSPEMADKIHYLVCLANYINYCETNNLMWIDEFGERLSKYKLNTGVKEDSNNKMKPDVPEDQLEHQLEQKLSELRDITAAFNLCDKSSKKLSESDNDHKTKFIFEMIILDIMSILDSFKCLANNVLFLDDNAPLLSGKCLRNHLAHGNALFDLLYPEFFLTLLANAQTLTENTKINIKRKIGNVVPHDTDKLKEKYDRGLHIISRQEEMTSALNKGNFEDFKACLKEGADTNSRSINLWTSFHTAARGPNLEIIKFLFSRKVKTKEQNVTGQTPLHVAASYGRTSIVDFLVNETGSPINVIDRDGKTPLHLAAENGHRETVEILLSLGASHTIKDRQGYSPVHHALAINHVDVVKVLLGKEVNVDSNEIVNGFTGLHMAAEFGHAELVQYLLRNNADANAKTLRGLTPLHLAAINGHLEVVNTLINKGAQVNAVSCESGCIPLHYAAENSHEGIVKVLLEHGAFVNIGNYQHNHTPLHWAASNGHKGIVEFLIKYKADINVAKYDGTTPLLCAAAKGHLEVIDLLILNGSQTDSRNGDGFTALHLSIVHGHNNIVKSLIKKMSNIHIEDSHRQTPLHLAVAFDNQVAVDILLEEGADVKSVSIDGSTPLHLGARKGNEAILEALLKKGAPLNAVDVNKFTPLHVAAQTPGSGSIIELLIKHGADVNVKGIYNTTPLHVASFLGHSEAVDVLIKNNAIVNAKTIAGDTPLHLAAEGNHKAVVEILVKHDTLISKHISAALCRAVRYNYGDLVNMLIAKGADVNTEGGEPLKIAISAGYRSIVEVLLKNKNIDIDVKDLNGSTLLHLAALNGNWNIGKALIKKGAKIDAETSDKITPLSLAVHGGHKEFVNVLLSNGANVDAVFSENHSVLHVAVSGGHPGIVEILLSSGAKHNIRDVKNRTALELAVFNSQLHIVQEFFRHCDININERGNDNWTVLHIAAQSGNLEIIKFLVKRGADVNAINRLGSKPIHIAAREGFMRIVEFFLEYGMSIADEGVVGQTLLHYAAIGGQAEVTQCLIGKRADINAVDHNGMLPIHLAAKDGQLGILKILLQSGSIYDGKDKFGNKPVHIAKNKDITKILVSVGNLFKAVKINDISDIEGLIKDGAPVNARSADKSALLHFVCWKDYGQACDVLLKNKADPNVTGKKGNTPLHYAAKYSHLKIVQSLLSNSAKYNAMIDNGKTPLDFAMEEGRKEIIDLLKLVDSSFQKVESGDAGVIDDLKKKICVDNTKAIMKARNKDGKSLVVVAIDSNFPKVDKLKQVLQENITLKLAMVDVMLGNENFNEALCVLKEVVEERREILGEDNPGTLDILEKIATILYKQSKYSESLELHEEIYQKQLEALGPNSKDSLRLRSAIALILHRQGKDQEALDVFQDVYEKQMKILGEDHVDVLKTRMHLALSLEALRKYEEALSINYKNYEKIFKIFGAKDPFTLSAHNNIAMVLNKLGRHDEAMAIFQKVYETRKIKLGPNHSDTLRVMHNMASVLVAQNKSDEALKFFQKVLAIQKNVLGLEHRDTLNTQSTIGMLSLSQNRMVDAMQAFKAGADQWKTILGTDHPRNIMIDTVIQQFDKLAKLTDLDIDRIQNCQLDVISVASKGDVAMLENLIQDGSDVNTADAEGRTPLHFTASERYVDVVKVLLKRGADATAVTTKGNTPLHAAASQDCVKIAELLLQNVKESKQIKFNEFINAKTVVGGTSALHVACKKGSLQMVKCLLKYGARYNPVDRGHNATPLQYSQSPSVSSLLQLIQELFQCAKKGDRSIIKKLSALETDDLTAALNAKDDQLQTPLQVAIVNKHNMIATSLSGILKEEKNVVH